MKTQRRQDLKTNDLSVYMKQIVDYFSAHAVAIVAGAAVVLMAVAAAVYANHTATLNRELGWKAYREVVTTSAIPDPENPNWATDAIDQWETLIGAFDDPTLHLRATWQLAGFCLQQFIDSDDDTFRGELLDTAERQCRAILDRDSPNVLRAAALNGLAVIEENRYVIDGSDLHKDRARGYLEQLRNQPEFLGTPFQAQALARLNAFDELWQPLELAPPPPEPLVPDQLDEVGVPPSIDNFLPVEQILGTAPPPTPEAEDVPPTEENPPATEEDPPTAEAQQPSEQDAEEAAPEEPSNTPPDSP